MAAPRSALKRKARKTQAVLPQTRAKTRGAEANVQRILDAALSVFAIDGFAGARIDAIARLAGLSKPNLLYYFRTKHDLYLAVLKRTLEMWLVPLSRIDAGSDPSAALADYVTEKLEYARDYPKASRLFANEVMRGAPVLGEVLRGDLKRHVDCKVTLLKRWMAQGKLPRRDPHHLIFMIWATTQHYADFSTQVEAITGRTLHHPTFFADARQSILQAVLGPNKD